MECNHPLFSVIVPTFNQAQYLGQALDSLLAQTDLDWEGVVVDDGSTDGTRDVLEVYQAKDPRIRVIHKENGGTGSALNQGLQQARGEWICWLSSDDLFDSRKLEIHRREIGRHSDCQFFITLAREFDDVTGRSIDAPYWPTFADRNWQVLHMLVGNCIYGNSICVNRNAWERVGAFDESLRYAQDYDMWLRLLILYPAVLIPEQTCLTRCHALQGTHKFSEACMYDSATAAIHLLNKRTFADLLPMVDLDDPRLARKAIVTGLSIASKAAGYLYALGPHPALLWRIVEWAWDTKAGRDRSIEQQIIRAWASEVSRQYDGSTFGSLWKALANLTKMPQPEFRYREISPLTVAGIHYRALQSRANRMAAPLRRYLQDYENRLLPEKVDRASRADDDAGMWFAIETPKGGTGFQDGLPGAGVDLAGLSPQASVARRWIPYSALVASAHYPDLLRERRWWILMARSTFPGQAMLLLAEYVLARAIPQVYPRMRRALRRGAEGISQ